MGSRGWALGTPEVQADGRPAAPEASTSQSKAFGQARGGRSRGQKSGQHPVSEAGTRQRLGLQEAAAL